MRHLSDRSAALIVLFGWGLVASVSALFPTARLWGINHLAFVSWPTRITFGLALVICLVLTAFSERLALILNAWRPAVGRAFDGWRGAALLVTAVGIAMWLLRAREAFLGDGTMRATDAFEATAWMPSELLPTFLASTLARDLPLSWGIDGFIAYRILSILFAVCFAVALWRLTPRVSDSGHRSLIFWILSFGTIRLLAGYVEVYTPAVVAVTLWTLAALAYRRGAVGPAWVIALWTVAAVSHVVAVVLVPATVWLFITGKTGDARWQRTPLLVFIAAALVVGGGLVDLFHRLQVAGIGISTPQFLLPILPTPPHDYGLLSLAHLVDFINQWLLLAPAAIALLVFCWRRDASEAPAQPVAVNPIWWRRERVFWALAAGLPLAAALLIDPKLGCARDWDLFSVLFAPALVGVAMRLKRTTGRIRAAAMSMAVLSAGLWLVFSVDADAERRRFEALLDLDRTRSDYGHEIMAQYYRRHQDYAQAIFHYNKALSVTDNPRYRLNIAAAYYEMGDLTEADRWYRDVLLREATNAAALHGLSIVLERAGKLREARRYADRALAANPDHPDYQHQLGAILLQLDQYRDALPHLERAARAEPPKVYRSNALGLCYLMLGRLAEAKTAFEDASRLDPNEAIVWLNAARVALAQRELGEASRLLRRYEDLVPPAKRNPEAKDIADSLRAFGQ